VVFYARARSIAGEVAETYSPSRDDDGRAAHRTFVILTAAGGAAVATGAVLYYLGWRVDRSAITVAPAVSRDGAGVSFAVRF
jgi:hypothetical protein